MTVTFKGSSMNLVGSQRRAGDALPDFRVYDNELSPVKLSEIPGIKVFAAVPSLDTGVCDQEIRKLNQKAEQLGGIEIYAVSLDLPFAQARWCGAAGVHGVHTLSDYFDRSFAAATGTLIAELALLTRAVFIADETNRLVYVEYVPEVTEHPDYGKLYEMLEKLKK